MVALTVRNLCFTYQGATQRAVDNVSFSLEKGSYTALLGLNGSGKSTIARIIAGLLEADSGTVENTQNYRIGTLFQSPKDQIICSTVGRDTGFAPRNMGLGNAETELRTIESLQVTDMLSYANHKTMSLSLGQTQKVAFSGILAMNPDILIMDEALSMIDVQSKGEMLDFLDKLNQKGITVIHITHEIEAVNRANDVIVMDCGKKIWQGSKKEFFLKKDLVNLISGPYLEPLQEKFVPNDDSKISFAAKNICFSYGTQESSCLKDVSFSLYKGTLTALTGPSGAGKSTLLEICSGLIKSQSGEIYCERNPALAQQNSDAAVFENFAADDVAFGPKNQGISGRKLRKIVEYSMNLADLPFEKFANRQTFCMSGGEKKRLAVAGIVALDSSVIFFDEPTAALDGQGRFKILQMMKKLAQSGKTVLFTTHRTDEADFADRIIALDNGTIQFDTACLQQKNQKEKNDFAKFPKKCEAIPSSKILDGLRNFSFGTNKQKKQSVFEKMPVLLNFFLFLTLFSLSLVFKSIWISLLIFALSFIYAMFAKYPAKKLVSSLLKILPFLLIFCLFQMAFAPVVQGEKLFLSYKYFSVSPSKVLLCLRTVIHTESALCCICGFFATVCEEKFVTAIEKLVKPLKIFHIPINRLVLMAELTFRFVPLLVDEASCIIKTQLVRGGLRKSKGFFSRIFMMLPLFVPLIIQTLNRAGKLADAVVVRSLEQEKL